MDSYVYHSKENMTYLTYTTETFNKSDNFTYDTDYRLKDEWSYVRNNGSRMYYTNYAKYFNETIYISYDEFHETLKFYNRTDWNNEYRYTIYNSPLDNTNSTTTIDYYYDEGNNTSVERRNFTAYNFTTIQMDDSETSSQYGPTLPDQKTYIEADKIYVVLLSYCEVNYRRTMSYDDYINNKIE